MLGLSPYFPHWRFVTTRLVGFASVPYKRSHTFKSVCCTSSHFRTAWKRSFRKSLEIFEFGLGFSENCGSFKQFVNVRQDRQSSIYVICPENFGYSLKNWKFVENLQNLWKGIYGQTTIQVRDHLYPITGGVFEGLQFSQLFAIWVKNFPFSYLARHSIWRCLRC